MFPDSLKPMANVNTASEGGEVVKFFILSVVKLLRVNIKIFECFSFTIGKVSISKTG